MALSGDQGDTWPDENMTCKAVLVDSVQSRTISQQFYRRTSDAGATS